MILKIISITAFLFLNQIAAQDNSTRSTEGTKLTDNINDITVLDMNNKEVKSIFLQWKSIIDCERCK